MTLGKEPTLIIYAVLAALNAVQVAAVSMSTTAHVVVIVVTAFLAALVNRANVVPVGQEGK